MSITLKLAHVDGLRLRQQASHNVERTQDGQVIRGKEWKFEQHEVEQDRDPRRVGSDGQKIPLGTYTVYITAGLKNLVIERKGKVDSFQVNNTGLRNQMRIKYQKLHETGKAKNGKPVMEWKDDGVAQYVPANSPSGVYVGDHQRAIIDEMPT